MKTLTQIRKVNLQNQTTKQRVQRVLGWSDLRFGNFQYDMGCRWLETEFDHDKEVIDMLTKERLFWSWWINHWARRDEAFLGQFEGTGRNDLELAYQLRHNPQAVVFKLQNTILRHSYAKLMGDMIDDAHGQ